MSDFKLMPWAKNAVANAVVNVAPVEPSYQMPAPLDQDLFADQLNVVSTAQEAKEMAQVLAEADLRWIGIDSEFRYSTPVVFIKGDRWAKDCRSVEPLLVSLTAVVAGAQGALRRLRFVVDVREGEVLPALDHVLRQPVPFVGHFLKVELFTLWKLGLPAPTQLWDTWVAEKCRYLGLHHVNYETSIDTSESDSIQASQNVVERERIRLSLVETCRRHQVEHSFSQNKDTLQKSFLDNGDRDFSVEQLEYASEDATAAADLYPLQVANAAEAGILHHHESIEMPWVAVNARVQWNGVRIDPRARDLLKGACAERSGVTDELIAQYGIENHRSHPQLTVFFRSLGLLDHFSKSGKYTFDKDRMKENQELHPVVPLILDARRIQSLSSGNLLTPVFEGLDGRIHADHRQIGADSGRQSCRWPNLLGLDRTQRPLIVPDVGYGIGEVDLSQIEVGISGAVYGDARLIEMFNSGDVYSSMAQVFFADELGEEGVALSASEFKKVHRDKRDTMKTCTLGMIYGLTSHGLALKLKCSESVAEKLQGQFMSMFPDLSRALQEGSDMGERCGWVSSVTGLRRYRKEAGKASNWERNWMRNHPVQASAADAFKVAGIRLDKLYRQHDARIILPVHDAFVFEAPLKQLDLVAQLTSRTMIDAVVEFFPQLKPKTDINIEAPHCWNKDGEADALEKWVAEAPSIEPDKSLG